MLWQLFWSFFKIGAVTFGSGLAMIPIIEKEVVEKRKWFEKSDFYDHFAIAQACPGPIVINTAVFVGYRRKGVWGAIAAVLGCVIPSFVIILVVALVLQQFRSNRYVSAAFRGLMPAVVALIAVPFFRMLQPLPWSRIFIGLAAAMLLWFTGISPVWAVVAGLAIGIVEAFVNYRRRTK